MTGDGAAGTADLFGAVDLGPVRLRNRLVKAATFENAAPDGRVSDRLVAFHREVAAGGAGLTTVAYCAVEPTGRTYRHQLVAEPGAVPGLSRLTDAVHTEGGAAALQLGHAGWFANPRVTGVRPLGPSAVLSPHAMARSRAAGPADLDRVLEAFRTAGRLGRRAGFDVLEVHLGHGYLLSQFLSPWTNRRDDEYGGDVGARSRFPRQAVTAVREGAGDGVAVTAKLNMSDGFRSGLQLPDGVAVARLLEADGDVDALQLTGGFTGRTPMYLMRGDNPLPRLADQQSSLLMRLGMKAMARWWMDDHDFEEAFFLPQARQVRAEVDLPLMLLGGITRLDTMRRARREGFELVAMARALLREPDLPARLAAGDSDAGVCVPCNRCMVEMERDATRCVFRPEGALPAVER